MSRRKGVAGELELAKVLRQLDVPARRGQQYHGGPGSPDVVTALVNVHFECKRTERLELYKALAQADAEKSASAVAVVAHRRNGKGWIAILHLEDLVDLLRQAGRVAP